MKIDVLVRDIIRSGLVEEKDRDKLTHVIWQSIEESTLARDISETEMSAVRQRLLARFERCRNGRVWLDEMLDTAFPQTLSENLSRTSKSQYGRALSFLVQEMFEGVVTRVRHGDNLVRVVRGVMRKWTPDDEAEVDYMLGIK